MKQVQLLGMTVALLVLACRGADQFAASAIPISFSNSMAPGGRTGAPNQNLLGRKSVNGENTPSISIQGHVKKPGRYVWPAPGHDQTVLDAVNVAGGFDSVANAAAVRVTHVVSSRSSTVVVVNVESAQKSGSKAGATPTLHPGDSVFVPRRMLPLRTK